MFYLLSRPNLFDVIKYINDVPDSPGTLFDLGGQSNGGHGHHVKRDPDERFGKVEPVKENAACGHRNLKHIIESLVQHKY